MESETTTNEDLDTFDEIRIEHNDVGQLNLIEVELTNNNNDNLFRNMGRPSYKNDNPYAVRPT